MPRKSQAASAAPGAKPSGKWAHLGAGHWVTIHYEDGEYRHVFIRDGGAGKKGTVVAGAALRAGAQHRGKVVAKVEHHAAGAPNPGAAREARYARLHVGDRADRNLVEAQRNLAAIQRRNRRAEGKAAAPAKPAAPPKPAAGPTLREMVEKHRAMHKAGRTAQQRADYLYGRIDRRAMQKEAAAGKAVSHGASAKRDAFKLPPVSLQRAAGMTPVAALKAVRDRLRARRGARAKP